MKVFAQYIPVFQLGGFEHSLYLYPEYTTEQGLAGQPQVFRSSLYSNIMKEVRDKLTRRQSEKIKVLMQRRQEGIISPDAIYYSK